MAVSEVSTESARTAPPRSGHDGERSGVGKGVEDPAPRGRLADEPSRFALVEIEARLLAPRQPDPERDAGLEDADPVDGFAREKAFGGLEAFFPPGREVRALEDGPGPDEPLVRASRTRGLSFSMPRVAI